MNAVASVLPAAAWRSVLVLRLMSLVAGPIMRAGRIALVGRTPNGHRFAAGPRTIWMVRPSTARRHGQDLGSAGPLPEQARIGDFWIPQRGVIAQGQAWFDGGHGSLRGVGGTDQPILRPDEHRYRLRRGS